jgi:hypothetical protein
MDKYSMTRLSAVLSGAHRGASNAKASPYILPKSLAIVLGLVARRCFSESSRLSGRIPCALDRLYPRL